jgi:ribosomal protein S18 acetylase RimI-like enzyme
MSNRTISFAEEKIAVISHEAFELLVRNYREVETDQDLPLDPDWEAYLAAERLGSLVVLTARVDRKLVGYLVYSIRRNRHVDVKEAYCDTFYVLPEYRQSGIALRLLRFGEDEMRKRQVKLLYHCSKTDPKHHKGAIFEHLGYHAEEVTYSKRLT